jgi:CspA family cold shock protein
MPTGTVKWFNSQKGYGFIQPQGGGKDVFVRISAVERAGLSGLNEGQAIEYEDVSDRGKTSAGNLKVRRWSRPRISRREQEGGFGRPFCSYRAVEFFLQTFRHPLELLDRE